MEIGKRDGSDSSESDFPSIEECCQTNYRTFIVHTPTLHEIPTGVWLLAYLHSWTYVPQMKSLWQSRLASFLIFKSTEASLAFTLLEYSILIIHQEQEPMPYNGPNLKTIIIWPSAQKVSRLHHRRTHVM